MFVDWLWSYYIWIKQKKLEILYFLQKKKKKLEMR